MKWTPHPYQKKAIAFGVSRGAAAFLLDPGLGKTSIMLAIYKVLRQKRMARRMLVIAPLRVAHSVWPAEAARWDEFRDLKVVVLHGPDKEAKLKENADIFVINPEGLPWLTTHKMEDLGCDILVVDESTKFKHVRTQRFKTLRPLLGKFRRRYILTGSPAPNGLMDLFGQVYILDLGASLGQYITHYRMNYFDAVGFNGYVWAPKVGSEQRIYDKLKPLALRMAQEDYLDLEPYIENIVEVELPAPAMKIYKQMEELLIAEVQAGVVTAANAVAAMGKCRQIANGGIYHEDGKYTQIHDAKTEAVVDLVDELSGKPALVAYEYKHDLARLRAVFPAAPFIGGGVSTAAFRDVEAAWNAGQLPVLFAQPQSVAHGLNLQEVGSAVLWHSLTLDLEVDEQFVRRVWRQGQRERVVVHRIVAKGTVDEMILKLLRKKDRTQRALLSALKEYAG